MTALNTLRILSTSFTWKEWFSNDLEGVPTYAGHLLAAFPSLCGPTHPKPSQFGWGRGILEDTSTAAAPNHFPSWSNSPYTAWRCVLGHCPVGKKMIIPLRSNQIGWRIAAECCGSHAGLVCFEFQINHRQCHQQSTPTTSHLLLHASWWEPDMQRSSVHLLCVSQRHGGWNQKSKIWTHQTKGQISTSLILMSIACVF